MKACFFIPLFVGFSLIAFSQQTGIVKVPIEGKKWYQLTNASSGLEGLFDGITNERVETGWGKIITNYDAYYALEKGETLTLTSIKFFDFEGTLGDYPMTVSVVTSNGTKKQIATFTGSEYNTWVGPYPDRQLMGEDKFKLDTSIADVRFLVLNCWYQFPTEIEFYGYYTAPTNATTPAVKSPASLKNMFGINAFEWDFENPVDPMVIDENRMKTVKNFTAVRHYMDWEKPESNEGSYTYNPVHSGGWNYDAIYERCKAENIEVLACLKTLPNWMLATYPEPERDAENIPMRYGKDPSNPWSYIEQAKMGFQYIARYGANPNVDPSLLSVNTTSRWTADPINTIKIGMNVIKYIECDNERDKWWKGRKAYQTAFEYAANLSAFYDGHKGTMGAGVGVKNADSTVKVVMGGLALPTTDYLRGMIDWCKINRGFKPNGSPDLCWDVINYHFYSNDANSSQGGYGNRGAAPELSGTAEAFRAFLDVAHRYANDMPIWITELGYDINQGSPYRAIPIGNKTAAQTQADWILRSALLYEREGANKLFFYQLNDDNLASPGAFASMGFINADKTNKLAADFLAQTNQLIGHYTYQETVSTSPLVDLYSYNDQIAYAVTMPTENGSTASYTFDLTDYDSARICSPRAGSSMLMTTVKLTKGKLTMTAAETPQFIIPVAAAKKGNGKPRIAADIPVAEIVEAFPNPSNNLLNILITSEHVGALQLNVIQASTGNTLHKYQLIKRSATLQTTINLSSLIPGMYVLDVVQGNHHSSKKILKLK